MSDFSGLCEEYVAVGELLFRCIQEAPACPGLKVETHAIMVLFSGERIAL